MSWVRLDDGYPDHPKIAVLSDRAFRVHTRALCHAWRFKTTGLIDGKTARRFGATPTVLHELTRVVAGFHAPLWEVQPASVGGWYIHDFEDFEVESREQQRREKTRERMRRLRERRRQQESDAGVTQLASPVRDAEGVTSDAPRDAGVTHPPRARASASASASAPACDSTTPGSNGSHPPAPRPGVGFALRNGPEAEKAEELAERLEINLATRRRLWRAPVTDAQLCALLRDAVDGRKKGGWCWDQVQRLVHDPEGSRAP